MARPALLMLRREGMMRVDIPAAGVARALSEAADVLGVDGGDVDRLVHRSDPATALVRLLDAEGIRAERMRGGVRLLRGSRRPLVDAQLLFRIRADIGPGGWTQLGGSLSRMVFERDGVRLARPLPRTRALGVRLGAMFDNPHTAQAMAAAAGIALPIAEPPAEPGPELE